MQRFVVCRYPATVGLSQPRWLGDGRALVLRSPWGATALWRQFDRLPRFCGGH